MTGEPAPRGTRLPRLVLRAMLLLLLSVAGFFAVAAVILLFLQSAMVYPGAYPRVPNGPEDFFGAPETMETIAFDAPAGAQKAFYIPPPNGEPPEAIWLVFAGNASRGLDWRFFAGEYPNPAAAFLLLDMPGYGDCDGSPSPAANRAAFLAGIEVLRQRLDLAPEDFHPRLRVMGHSLGAANALVVADALPVRGVVLLSPFYSMHDMAVRTVGYPLAWVLTHRYDNGARLASLAGRADPPSVHILHGAGDTIIPVTQARKLAEAFPDLVVYTEFPAIDHNNLVSDREDDIRAAMLAIDGVASD